jgi:hypothetical protein
MDFPVNHSLMVDSFAAAFFKMGLLGQADNHDVSDYVAHFIPATDDGSHS